MDMGVGGTRSDDNENGSQLVRSTAALTAGRCASTLSQLLGRGSGEVIGGRLALRLVPDYDGHLPPGLPQDWLEPLRQSRPD